MSDQNRALADLAARQLGAFTRAQAREAGVTRATLQRRLTAGRWEPGAPGVLLIAGTPPHPDRALWIAVLSLGPAATVSFESAGRLIGLDAMPRVEAITLPHYDHRRRAGITIHQQRIEAIDRTVLDGLPVTTVQRTLCDLAMVFSLTRLRHVVQTAHAAQLCSLVSVGSTLMRVGTLGRPGSSQLVTVLDEMGPGEPVPATELEARLDSVIEMTGLPRSVSQYPLPGGDRRRGLVDRAFPDAKLIVEADGRRWHARHAAMVTDHERDFEAGRVGWHTVRLMYEQLVADPTDIAAGLIETYRSRADAA